MASTFQNFPQFDRFGWRFSDRALEMRFERETGRNWGLVLGLSVIAAGFMWGLGAGYDLQYRDAPLADLRLILRGVLFAASILIGLIVIGLPRFRLPGRPIVYLSLFLAIDFIVISAIATSYAFDDMQAADPQAALTSRLINTGMWTTLTVGMANLLMLRVFSAALVFSTLLTLFTTTLIVVAPHGSSTPYTNALVPLFLTYVLSVLAVVFLNRAMRRQYFLTRAYEDMRISAEQARDFMSVVLTATGHDVRQPVYALDANAEALGARLDRGDLEGASRLAQDQKRLVRNLSNMLTSVLELSSLDRGKRVLNPERIALNQIIEDVCATLADLATARGIELRAIPSTATTMADIRIVERILINLVTNAIVHGQADRVVIGVRRRADGESVMVVDNGRGLPGPARSLEGDTILGRHRKPGRGLPGFGFEIMQSLSVLGGLRFSVKSEPGRGVAAELLCPEMRD